MSLYVWKSRKRDLPSFAVQASSFTQALAAVDAVVQVKIADGQGHQVPGWGAGGYDLLTAEPNEPIEVTSL